MTEVPFSMRDVEVGSVAEENQRFGYEIVLDSQLTRVTVPDTVNPKQHNLRQ
jgi:hypothetical protein